MLKDFFEKLKSGELIVVNPQNIDRKCRPSSAMLDMCIDEMADSLVEHNEFSPVEGTYVVDNGYRLGRYTDDSICQRPFRLDKDGDYIVSADHDRHAIFYYDKEFNLQKKYYLGDVSDNRYPKCVAISETKLFVGTDYNRIICIDKVTGDVDWAFGTYGHRGKCSEGYIGEVMQIQLLSTGNLLVATYEGAGDLNKYYGTLEEFAPDGTWVKTHLQYNRSGQGVDGETRYPQSLRIYDDIVYVGKSNEIDVFSYADGELTYAQTIRKPSNSGVDDLSLRDFVIEDGILYITSPGLKKVVGFDLNTHTLTFSAGIYSYEASGGIKHTGNGMNYPDGIVIVDGHIYIADTSNYNITEVFKDNFIYPEYDIPENISEVIYSSLEMDGRKGIVPVGEEPPKLTMFYRS